MSQARVTDNLLAADIVLTDSDKREIDAAFARIDIKGAPISAALDALNDR